MTSRAAALTASPGAGRGPQADALAGTRDLARFALRRDRIMLPVWVYALTVIAAEQGFGLKLLYKMAQKRMLVVASVRSDPALSFLYGELHGSSLGAVVSWRYLAYATVGAGLMSIFLVVRHTRADEETGRLELIGSTAVARRTPLAVAMLIALAANVVLLVLVTAVLAISGLPLAGSAAFALGAAGGGLVFAAVAAVAAQASGTARGARGLAIAVLAVAFLLRGVGDSGGSHGLSWLTWLSPVGWAELIRPFAAERWWVLALPAAATLVLGWAAFGLADRRDHGVGMIQPRPGPAGAGSLLTDRTGLAWLSWRLNRLPLAAWAAGFLAFGLAIGVVTKSIGQLVGSSAAVDKAFRQIGGQAGLTNAYLAACMSLFGLAAAAYAVSVVQAIRSEEASGGAEALLAGPVSRLRWGGSHLLTALTGTVVVLVAAGFGVGFGYGAASSSLSAQLPRLIDAALVQVPAALAVAGVAAAAVGLLPRWSGPVGWTALAFVGFVGVFGPALSLPRPLLDIAPFTHVPRLPGGALSATPLIWLSAVAVLLAAASLAGLRRRDIG